MKQQAILFFILLLSVACFAKTPEDSTKIFEQQMKIYEEYMDSVNKAMKYETGKVMLSNRLAELNIPAGFKFLNAEQSNFVITEAWGNPPQEGILGMIFPKAGDPFSDSSYAFVVTFEDMGYVKDKDADDIDYGKMLKETQAAEAADNKQRAAMGYEPIHNVGWAQKPYYDKKNKVLHWAKELRFGDAEINTLNYDVRILGRSGVLSLNAVATVNELEMVKADIDKVLAIPSFTSGNRYEDFDSKTDKIAAYTVGGLVAGKVLAKVGAFAFLAKFGKIIFLAVAAAGGAVWKFITGRRKKEDEFEVVTEINDSTGDIGNINPQ